LAQQATSGGQQSSGPKQPSVTDDQMDLFQLQRLENSYQFLLAELREKRQRYSDSHPDIVTLKIKLDRVREQERTLLRLSPSQLSNGTGLKIGLTDRWWKNPLTVTFLALTADQQKRMDDVFQRYRLKLIDLNAALEKEEVTMDPLVSAEPLEESKITAQIDRVAQARAELEKSNGRMLLGIRKLLMPEQWSKLNQLSPRSAAN